MIKEGIQRIVDLALENLKPEEIIFQDLPFSTKKLERILLPEPKTIETTTLSSVVDYVKKNPGGEIAENFIIHISDYNTVSVRSSLTGPFLQRREYLRATAFGCGYQFDRFYDFEMFIISLQAHFEDSEDRKRIMKMIGNLTDENIKTLSDDGVTQVATVKTGVAMVKNENVPNPVNLAPYRTFREIEQPASDFVFRIKAGKDAPGCALFQADGEKWKLSCIEKIKHYLLDNIGDSVPIIA